MNVVQATLHELSVHKHPAYVIIVLQKKSIITVPTCLPYCPRNPIRRKIIPFKHFRSQIFAGSQTAPVSTLHAATHIISPVKKSAT